MEQSQVAFQGIVLIIQAIQSVFINFAIFIVFDP
jgi:hypothetical protein